MKNKKIAVVGLGYVGLPIAVAFGKKFATMGFDLDRQKIENYRKGVDPTGELNAREFSDAKHLEFFAEPESIKLADFVIITVPTPIDEARRPDLTPLQKASATVGRHMKKGCIVVYESTVYPGLTEEVCIPLLEENSGMKWKMDFHVGYSPERINPGDKEHRLETIVKVVAGDDEETLDAVANLYSSIVKAGVHRVSSIKVAEAAKVIENTQRDLNIALMNELAMIFKRMDIDSLEVLKAAGTKWNFLPFRPGLVGGHCIGVDPYYLTFKAEKLGFHPDIILAGRRTNDGMAKFIVEETLKHLVKTGNPVKNMRIAVLGLSFKENCKDLRNSKVVDIISEFQSYGINVLVHDPVVDPKEAKKECGRELSPWESLSSLDVLILAVSHEKFLRLSQEEFEKKMKPKGLFVDVKSVLDANALQKKGFHVWRL